LTDYTKSTSFATKDALATGNPLKIVKGTEIDTEFNNIAVAIATKADLASPALTGTPTAPTASGGTSSTQLATTAFVQAAINALTGAISLWPTNSAPSGYLLCNGALVSRTTYAGLFAVLGTTYGAGDGSTTFALPDTRDRMPMGAGTTYAAGATGGSKDAIVVSHTHTASVTDPGHGHNFVGSDFTNSGTSNGGSAQNMITRTTDAHVTGISVNISTNGSSGTNANLPPYLGFYFIIKT